MLQRALWTVLALTLLVAACGTDPTSLIALDAEDTGSTIFVEDETLVEITLVANPSTGYNWEVAAVDDRVLRQVGEPTFVPGSDQLGAAGLMTLTFECMNPGETELALAYRHPWVVDEAPLRTFSVTVIAG